MNTFVEWGALANVLVMGILVGAGLPTLFAIAVRVLHPHGEDADVRRHEAWRKVVAYICFGIGAVTVLGGIAYIAAGGH
mgnify:CR=1 FL=1